MSTFISILISSVLFSCTPSSTKKPIVHTQQEHAQVITQKVEQIKKSYQNLIDSDDSVQAQKEYFDAFPNSFDSFVSLFGYSVEESDLEFKPNSLYDKPAPLSRGHFEYIHDFFNKLSSINKEIFLKKIVNICIGGYWQADAINLFRSIMKEPINQYFEIFYSILKTHSKKEIKSFWYFYFAGPAPYHTIKVKDYNQLIKKLNTLDKDMVPVVKEAYTTEKEYWEKP